MARFGRSLKRAAEAVPALASSSISAAGSKLSALEGLATVVKGFVEALSPSTVQMFGRAMMDLTATVGQAFLPALQLAGSVVRSIADQISPAMRALAPIFTQLVQVFGGIIVQYANAVAVLLQASIPILEALLDLWMQYREALMTVYVALIGLAAGVLTALVPVLQMLQPVLNALMEAFRQVITTAILLAAHLAKLLGLNQVIDSMLAAFGKKEEGRVTAAGPTSIKGLEQITKDLATSSAMAMGGGGAKEPTQNEMIRQIVDGLKEIQKGQTIQEFLEKKYNEFIQWVTQNFLEKPKQAAVGVAGAAVAVHNVNHGIIQTGVGLATELLTVGPIEMARRRAGS